MTFLRPGDLEDFDPSLDEWFLFAIRTLCKPVVIDFVMDDPSRFAAFIAPDLLRLSYLIEGTDDDEPDLWDAIAHIAFHDDTERCEDFRQFHDEWQVATARLQERSKLKSR